MIWLMFIIRQPGWVWPGPSKLIQKFSSECGWVFAVFFLAIQYLGRYAHEKVAQREKQEALYWTQKQRIRVLNDFEPMPRSLTFLDDSSIYNTIISLLQRLYKRVATSGAGNFNYKVWMLLCSPALDYPGNPNSTPNGKKQEWGREFNNIIDQLLGNVGAELVSFDVCHLPLESRSGFNVMQDFLAALASYVASEQSVFMQTCEDLMNRTRDMINAFKEKERKHTKERFRVRTPSIHIPFQIIMASGADFNEVVVSFADIDRSDYTLLFEFCPGREGARMYSNR